MGLAFQVQAAEVASLTGGATFDAATAAPGDSLTVPNFAAGTGGMLEEIWAQATADFTVRIRSPKFHDFVQGIRLQSDGGLSEPLTPAGISQRLFAQDLLTIEGNGTAAGVLTTYRLQYFQDLPGISARLAMPADVIPRIVNILGVQEAITTAATPGDWGGSQAIDADDDRTKANIDYAILGYLVDADVGAIGITGPDTGNTRLGGPGLADKQQITSEWFLRLSRLYGTPHIPIINSANKGVTTIDGNHFAASLAVNVTLIMAELAMS